MIEKLQEAPISATLITSWTWHDPLMSTVLHYVQQGWPTQAIEDLQPYWTRRMELYTEAICLIWGVRVVIPPQGRESVLTELHCRYPGVPRMKVLARGYVWWEWINKLRWWLDSVWVVNRINHHHHQHLSNLGTGKQGRGHACTYTCRLWWSSGRENDIDCDWCWLKVDRSNSHVYCDCTYHYSGAPKAFLPFGISKTMASDNGSQFTAAEFQDFVS